MIGNDGPWEGVGVQELSFNPQHFKTVIPRPFKLSNLKLTQKTCMGR